MDAMPRKLPKHVRRQRTRHGRVVFYFRRGDGPRIRLPEPSDPSFAEAYAAALAGEARAASERKAASGSLAWLVAQYRQTARWAALKPSTRQVREAIFRRILEEHGAAPFRAITRAGMVKSRDRRADRPAAARHFLDAMRGLFRWALEAELVETDPTAGVANPPRPRSGGFKPWTEEEIARYRTHWKLGTRQRVWLEVLLGTGLRRGDAVTIGRQHVRDGIATLRTEKTGEEVHLPIGAELAAALAAGPTGDLAWICGERGAPLTKESFGNLFRAACDAAGLKGRTAHGLRKADATRHAEAGATVAELEGRYGWSGGGMASLYTRSANRKRLALAAAERLQNEKKPHPLDGEAETAKKTNENNG